MNGNTALSYAAPPPTAGSPPVSPVFSALTDLDASLSVSHSLLDTLEQRLDAILAASPESKPGIVDQASASRLHSALLQQIGVSGGVNDRLRSLIERLTV